jgi:hypothetical protein
MVIKLSGGIDLSVLAVAREPRSSDALKPQHTPASRQAGRTRSSTNEAFSG